MRRRGIIAVGVEENSESHEMLEALVKEAGHELIIAFPALGEVGIYDSPKMPYIREHRFGAVICAYTMQLAAPGSVIMAFGSTAVRVLSNKSQKTISKLRGVPHVIPDEDYQGTFHVTYHPIAVIDGAYQYRDRILEDLRQLGEEYVEYPEEKDPVEGRALAIDMEFTPDDELLTIGYAGQNEALAYDIDERIEIEGVDCEVLPLGRANLKLHALEAPYIIAHFAGVDIDHLNEMGGAKEDVLKGETTIDTFLLGRMFDENRGKGQYNVETMLRSFDKVRPWKPDTEIHSKFDATKWPSDLRAQRCRLDAWASARLAKHLHEEVQKVIPSEIVRFQHKLAMSNHRIHLAGACINLDTMDELRNGAQQKKDEHEAWLNIWAKRKGMNDYIAQNDGHNRTLLYDKMGLTSKVETATGLASVSKSALAYHDDEPAVKHLLGFKKFNKVLNTWYGDGDDDGIAALVKTRGEIPFLHFRLLTMGTRTWRRASVDPNSQNWPKEVRAIVQSRWEGGKIANVDYSQLEPTILAWVAGENRMYEHFAGGSGYQAVAEDFFEFRPDKGTPEYRLVKAIVLGIGYGMGAFKLAMDLWEGMGLFFNRNGDQVPVPESPTKAQRWEHINACEDFIKRYFKLFPRVERYIEKQERTLLEEGLSYSPSGAIRRLEVPDGKNTIGYRHKKNEAINFPIQNFASFITGSAVIDVEADLVDRFYQGNYNIYHQELFRNPHKVEHPVIINEVHDSLVLDIPPGFEWYVDEVVRIMTEVPTLRKLCPDFPLSPRSEVDMGTSWGGEPEDG